MPATVVPVMTTGSTAGAPVAVDAVGGADYQQVKLVGGVIGDTSPIGATAGVPGGTTAGMIVAVIPGVSVTAAVSGTVSISGPVSGTLTVNTAPTVAGASITAQVSGTVTISPTVLTVNTAPTVAGASVTIQQGASVSAVVSGTVSVSGTAVVTLATGGSVTLVGTVGVSVVAAVSLSSIVPVTTAASVSVTGIPVWFNPTQGVNVSTVSGTLNFNLAAAGTTIPVNVVAGGSQTTVVSGTVAISIPVSQTVGTIIAVSGVTAVSAVSTIVTILGTQIVTLATGGSVTLVGTVGVSVIAAVSLSSIVPVTTQSSVSVTGIPVWWNPSATVNVSGVIPAVTTQSNATGAPIWLCPTQTITVTVGSSVVVVGRGGQVSMTVTSTSVIATNTTQFMLMTVNFDQYTSSALVSGYTVRLPMAVTGITVVYSGTSVTVPSVIFALYATTSGVSLTNNAIPLWSTVFPTMTGAAVLTTLNFPATIVLPANGVIGLAMYRSASSTVTCNIAATLVGQYLN